VKAAREAAAIGSEESGEDVEPKIDAGNQFRWRVHTRRRTRRIDYY
jgi:hypothetical protein